MMLLSIWILVAFTTVQAALISQSDDSPTGDGHVLRCYGDEYYDIFRPGRKPKLTKVKNLARSCMAPDEVSPNMACGLFPAPEQPMTFIYGHPSPMAQEIYYLNAQICHTKCSCLSRPVEYETPPLLPVSNQTLRYTIGQDRLPASQPLTDENYRGLILYGASPQGYPRFEKPNTLVWASWQIHQVEYYGDMANRPTCRDLDIPEVLQQWLYIFAPVEAEYTARSLCSHPSYGGRVKGNLGGVCVRLDRRGVGPAVLDIAPHRRAPQFTPDFYDQPLSLAVRIGLGLVDAYCHAACSCAGEDAADRQKWNSKWQALLHPTS